MKNQPMTLDDLTLRDTEKAKENLDTLMRTHNDELFLSLESKRVRRFRGNYFRLIAGKSCKK